MRDKENTFSSLTIFRKNSKSSTGSCGHAGDPRPGQTRKKPKDLSSREREDRRRGEGVCMMCVGNSEKRECGVGDSVNTTMLSETL